jgi:transposase
VSSYSENQSEARYGHNKSRDGLKVVKLLTQYCLETGQPVAYSKQPGNISDIISVINASEQLSVLNMERPMLVLDAGFYSEENILALTRRHIKCLIAGKITASWIKPEFEKNLGSMRRLSNNCPFDPSVYGITVMVSHAFQRVRQRGRGKFSKGDSVTEEHRVYLHLFLNLSKAECELVSLSRDIREVQAKLKSGVEGLSTGELALSGKYLTCRNTRGGLSVDFNEEVFAEATRFAGCFVLLSTAPMDTFAALREYRRRERIEEHFRMDKQYVDGNRTRVWYPDSLNGRFFCQFVALCYHEYFHKAVKEMKKTLAIKMRTPLMTA